jgi:1-acyl-sn-glycerol-3-phosphate acyltransferase
MGLLLELLFYAFIACAGWWVACYFRLCPVPLMRTWFTLVFAVTLIGLNWTTLFVDLLRAAGVFNRITSGRICAWLTGAWFKFSILASPHIKLIPINGAKTDKIFADAAKYKRHLVCFNHTSFFDGFAGLAIAPQSLTAGVRSMYKSSLAQIPLWGATYARRNDSAVHFTSSDKFTTDKEKQERETQLLREWVTVHDGTVALFPEGQLNKDPLVIQPIRRGMIKFAIENEMPVWICVQLGSHETWPLDAKGVGGYPADIFYDVKQFWFKEGETAEDASVRIQEVMQQMVNEVMEVKNKHQLKKKNV